MVDFSLKVHFTLILILAVTTSLCSQIQSTNIDNKGAVYAVLPTAEGPVYYVQKNDDVIYKNKENFSRLRMFDGHKNHDLHVLGEGGKIKGDVKMDLLNDKSILIRFTGHNLPYLYTPTNNKLIEFESPTGINIFSISIIDGVVYYCLKSLDETGEYFLVKYFDGQHDIICQTDYYISKIYRNGDQYLFLIKRLLNGKYLPYEWVQMDLDCNSRDGITGLENLSSQFDYYNVLIREVATNDEGFYFNKPDDLNADYLWDRRSNNISRVDTGKEERQVKRMNDEANNIVELNVYKSHQIAIELIKNNGERIEYNSKFDYDNTIFDIKSGAYLNELWIGSNDGLLRFDLPQQTYESLLVEESFRSIFPIDDEKLLVCTSGGNVYTIDRANYVENRAKRLFEYASDNRFIKRNSNEEIVFDGSWKIFRYNRDATIEQIYKQNAHPYTQLLTDDRLLISTNTASNFIVDINDESLDTSYLVSEIGKIIDCINLKPNIISTSTEIGLSIYDLNSKHFIFQDSSRHNALSLLLVDSTKLYVGYEDGFLREYEYLPDNVTLNGEWMVNKGFGIAKIIHTKENRLWLTTFDGVCIFDMLTREIRYLDKHKLSESECNRYSGFYDSIYNKVYVGTIGGLNIINEEIEDEQIDSFQCFFLESSYSLPSKDSIVSNNIFYNQRADIKLPSLRRNLTLSFASAYSTSDNKITYQYRLNGENWQNNGNSNILRFSYLKSGNNKIEIRAIHSDRYISSNTLIANVLATPFIYERWWFRLLVLFLLISGSWWWYRRMKTENIRLEKAVEDRTEELRQDKVTIEKQAHELGELDKLKNQFFANVSHELRTPLTLLISPIEGISEGENLTEEQRNLLLLMKDNGHLLQNRISELLELSRLTSNKVELKRQNVDVGNLIDFSTKIFEPLAQKKHLRFEIKKENVDFNIIGDENRLSKIIQNLIINAIKFTNIGGLVSCSFIIVEDILKITVEDTGIGIEDEYLDKVFQRFYQVKSNNANANPGTGIGLAMVAEYIELMNGEISVESEFGKGTTFNIEIPIEIASLSTESPLEKEVIPTPISFQPISSKQKPKLLIAEDNEDLRKYIIFVLQGYFEIIEAENGKVALELLHEDQEIDIILSDIMMPEMDGIALLNEVRNNNFLKLKPFVFLTAKHNDEDIANAFRLGVDDYLRKPFSEQELIYRLNAVYANYKSRMEFKLDAISSQHEDSRVEEPTSEFISELQEIVLSNITSNEFSLEFLAENLGISKSSLIRTVKKEIGLTPNKFILEIRLNKARQLYESRECLNLNEVASKVGFSTAWYFQKLYTERFGTAWGLHDL